MKQNMFISIILIFIYNNDICHHKYNIKPELSSRLHYGQIVSYHVSDLMSITEFYFTAFENVRRRKSLNLNFHYMQGKCFSHYCELYYNLA